MVAGVLAFAGFALIDSMALWDRAMSTLSLVLVATLIALVISLPLGIWAARSRTVSAVVRPVLDLLQTMPSMVLLIPAILFFGMGVPAGVVATLIFALAPGVRMTELGIRQVDAELVEAAEAFGTSPRDTLLRVQLPLALPTIMAGVNQVIMLGLSMVVIAGMVGTGGLGGAVNEAIGQLDIGLGFEAGLGIVVLAIYLDRMTGALGAQISPLGRRAAAKARTAGTPKLWNYRPRPAVALAGVVVLALVAGGLGIFGSSSQTTQATATDVGRGKKVTIGYIPWDEGIATTFLWKELLEERGFDVTTTQYAAGPLYTGLATGQIDFQTDSWLPVTHAEYWKKYGDQLEDLGKWYGPTSLELAVPSYVKGVDSLADLKGQSSKFKGRIVGIEPSAGMMGLLKDKVMGEYGRRRVRGRRRLHPGHARRTQARVRQEGTGRRHPLVAALGLQRLRPDEAQGPQGRLGRRRRRAHPRPQGLRRGQPRGRHLAEELLHDRATAHRSGGADPAVGQGQGAGRRPHLAEGEPRTRREMGAGRRLGGEERGQGGIEHLREPLRRGGSHQEARACVRVSPVGPTPRGVPGRTRSTYEKDPDNHGALRRPPDRAAPSAAPAGQLPHPRARSAARRVRAAHPLARTVGVVRDAR